MRQISPEQFQEYQQQWRRQPVDMEGHRQKQNAAFWVAYCYHYGMGGVEEDSEEATWMLQQVIQEQDRIAADNHNDNTGKHRYLLARKRHLNLDHDLANQLYDQAAPRLEMEVQQGGNDENFQQAAWYLGECFYFGFCMDKDMSRALHWYKIAAENGHAEAQFRLEYICSYHNIENVETLFEWWQQIAIQHEHVWAQRGLARCYKYGHGVAKDLVKAVEWYNKAISQGDPHSTRYKFELLTALSPEEYFKVLGCVERNQNVENVKRLIEQPNNVPLGLWAHVIARLQRQVYPPWESPSPTYLALNGGIMSQHQGQ